MKKSVILFVCLMVWCLKNGVFSNSVLIVSMI